MKFRQIKKDLFQLGSHPLAVWRRDNQNWVIGKLEDGNFIGANGAFYTRKGAAQWFLKKGAAEVFKSFSHDPKPLDSFGEPKKRPGPPPSFTRLLSKI